MHRPNRHLLLVVSVCACLQAVATRSVAAPQPAPQPTSSPEAPSAPPAASSPVPEGSTTGLPLAARLAAHLRAPAFSPEETGLIILSLPEGSTVLARNPDRPLRPASTMKILTSAAALSLLKPEFVYNTRILAESPIDADGAVAGNLYIQGSGAPDLVGEAWWLMTRRLAALGLRRVDGDLVGDESYFDAVRRPAGWPEPAADSWYNAPVGALSCNFNVVTVRIDPSPLVGARPDITLEPVSSFFQVMNRAMTTTGAASVSVARSFEGGQNSLVIAGTIRKGGGPIFFNRSVEEPALYALHAFKEIAAEHGIEIRGSLVTGVTPEKARELLRHESRPLGPLLRDMNKNSNNYMAESILKTLGAEFEGTPGTTASGIQVLRTYLSGLGLDPGSAVFADGSGLSDQDRVPARLLAEALWKARADFEIGPELETSLPIGGADGTLDERFGGEEARRRVRAKTGRIAGALSLAGYAANRDGHVFAFAFLANRPRGTIDQVHRAMDRVVDELVTSTDADLPGARSTAGAPR